MDAMVATVDDLLGIVTSNPFIDGVGYFIEVTTSKPVAAKDLPRINERMQTHFCAHAHASLDGDDVLGLDFHEHIFTQGEGSRESLQGLREILKGIEMAYGIEHLCVEFQFDMARARKAQTEVDHLLKP